jgi:ankyrin repeat protein
MSSRCIPGADFEKIGRLITQSRGSVASLLLALLAWSFAAASSWAAVGLAENKDHASYDKALLAGAGAGRFADVRALLQQGADPNATVQDRNRRSALILATAGGYVDTVGALLLAGADTEYKDNSGLTALNWAALRARNKVAERLLAHGADVNTSDKRGVTPLMYAAGTHNVDLLGMVIARGANLEAVSVDNKMTALLVAVENIDIETITLLLDKGANVNGTNQDGYSPLMAAAEAGAGEVVEILIARGANPAARDSKGATALMLARKHGRGDVVQLLEGMQGN